MHILDELIALWAPHTCVGCARDGALLCAACRKARLAWAPPRCYRCLASSMDNQTCAACLTETTVPVAAGLIRYEGVAKELIRRLKFSYARAAAEEMASMMLPAYRLMRRPQTVIVPVPTASSRVRQRGYDQTVLLARALSRWSGDPVAYPLYRHGQSQQHGASRQERLQNLQRAYTVHDGHRLQNRPIVLLDDVLTTGATFEAAAAALRSAGIGPVRALAFARA